MPIYEVKCETCGKDSEILVMRNEDMICPECGSPNVKKKISVGSFVYEGEFRSFKTKTDKKFYGED